MHISILWLSGCKALSSTIFIHHLFKAVAAFTKTRAQRRECTFESSFIVTVEARLSERNAVPV